MLFFKVIHVDAKMPERTKLQSRVSSSQVSKSRECWYIWSIIFIVAWMADAEAGLPASDNVGRDEEEPAEV